MLSKLACAGALIGLAVAAVLAANTPKFQLRGDRFKPLTYEEMTPAQRTLIDHLLSGPRGSVNGPFNVMLRSPELGDLQQAIGAYVRFKTSIPHKLNELAILMIGRHWNAQYEWVRAQAHCARGRPEPGHHCRHRRRQAAGETAAGRGDHLQFHARAQRDQGSQRRDVQGRGRKIRRARRRRPRRHAGLLPPGLDAAQSGPLSAAGRRAARAAGAEVRPDDKGASSPSLLRRHGLCASFRHAVLNMIR